MDSDDDMHDANDVQSVDDDFYGGETGIGSDDEDFDYDFVDNESDDYDDVTSRQQVKGWKKFSSLSLPFSFASFLLCCLALLTAMVVVIFELNLMRYVV